MNRHPFSRPRGLALAMILLVVLPGLGLADPGVDYTGQVRVGHFSVRWVQGAESEARHMAARLSGIADRIYSEIGAVPAGAIAVHVLSDEKELRQTAQAEQGGIPPEWASGLAYPSRRFIYVHADGPLDSLVVTLQHEVSHLALHDLPGGRLAPQWFKEGLAVTQSEGLAVERVWRLTEAASMDRLIPLSRLAEGFPRSGGRAGLAYAQSVHFVQYLRQRLGAAGFRKLLAALGTHRGNVESALFETLGVSSARISVEWHEHLRVRWGWLPIIFSETSLWIFAALLLLLGWWRRRTQARVKLDLMRREEERSIEGAIDIRTEPQNDEGSLDPYDGRPPTYH